MSGSSPYWLRLRGTGDKDEWDKGRRFGGHDETKGVEVLAASWDGAVVTRMRKKNGITWATVYLIPWGKEGQPKKGIQAVIFDGPIDGRPRRSLQQASFIPEKLQP